jgi:lipopolysaccharide/colanic/teichoic acid biosynthesis glycosyltransferase
MSILSRGDDVVSIVRFPHSRRVSVRERPVADMPLVQVEKPQYDTATSFGKATFDFCFALLALLAVLPVMIGAAIAVKVTSRGPVFYKSERVGLDGNSYQMIKFRSMYMDADKHLSAHIEMNEGAGGLLKMRDDPRVTSVGRTLRRLNLDKLPQFFNVLRGEMSVVGPRPLLRREIDAREGDTRRLLVKPGVTGLWQVSGRSDLSWEESVRLDLSYVENWSMVQDILIIKKTVSAVARSEGAY